MSPSLRSILLDGYFELLEMLMQKFLWLCFDDEIKESCGSSGVVKFLQWKIYLRGE